MQSVYEWITPDHRDENDAQVEVLIQSVSEDLSLPKMLIRVVYDKGYQTREAMESFLQKEAIFHDPFLFHDMEKAVQRLSRAIEDYENILIYGDYDADGISSTTILYETLESMGANVQFYLPNRFDDGYGPNKDVYAYYIKQGVQLILTCDNGVAGHEAIAYAKSQGVDVIVTDHHEIGDSLPDAYAIVHPRHPEGHYPFGDLAGAGVALKVASALLGETPTDLLDVAAIGTVADLVSLTGENRVIVSLGLEQMRHTERLGLQTFFDKESISEHQIDERTIGFILGPRLNALGRLGDPNPGVRFLTSFDDLEVAELVDLLDEQNIARKGIVEDIATEAFALVDAESSLPNIIILGRPGWHEGVLGIVASRLVEKYHRPTIMLGYNPETASYKGSGRSVEGVDLFKVLQAGKAFAQKFGGHEMAAGMTVSEANFDAWRQALVDEMVQYAPILNRKTPLHIDSEIDLSAITLENVQALAPLKPFGTDNQQPLFLLKNLPIQQIQVIGKNKDTMKLTIAEGDIKASMIAFKSAETAEKLTTNAPVDVVVTLSINSWNGSQEPQAIIQDIRQDGPSVFDMRGMKERDQIMSVQNALYLFEENLYFNHFAELVPYNSLGLKTADIPDLLAGKEIGFVPESIVIFDIPLDIPSVKTLVAHFDVKNVYVYAYSAKNAFMVGKPTREDFAAVYKYMLGHGAIPLKGKEQALADYFKMPKLRLDVIVEVMIEAGLVQWHKNDLVTIPVTEKVDLLKTNTMEKWHLRIEGERFLRYNDVEKIKDYFFTGGK
ncbi:single-stranded-DNA-specific exonuclease RecJ [Aerococcus agrisoli]|uniref:Single-stranded-DNA-specific exonuclease RecJ n=1 Tax=Aerococcus agrisoli TaxID=2487350 RepID=A0A3N4GHZ3_9LACT|nr:single-stranded-DNA-specific exonuclease RecJ [Aerococcus agrisoli]